MSPERTILGCDFSSSPTRQKTIVLAHGSISSGRLLLLKLEHFDSLEALGKRLAEPGDWVGGFDLPLGLPRELVQQLGWPTDWHACMTHYTRLSRDAIRQCFAAFCDARPAGGKWAHRATDMPAGSSPSMKWVNPPVAYMLHAGVPLLLAAGVHLPGLHAGDLRRVALEAYPGLLAREVLGRRPYKSDVRAAQTPQRLLARKDLIDALEQGRPRVLAEAGLRLKLTPAQRDALTDDASGDRLDAVCCMAQAAWALHQQRHGPPAPGSPGWGLPAFDPLEGWIVSA